MCLVFVGWRVHPRYPLVVAANRDEYHARATAPAAPWDESGTGGPAGRRGPGAGAADGRILAGRDLVAGGTWLGVTADGRFAALTNVGGSTPPGLDAPSRGRLPLEYLRGALGAREYARAVSREAERYSGFNLLLADRNGVHCVTNRGDERLTELAPGCHGLGNDRLNAPEPKVTGGLAAFRRRLAMELATDDLFVLLSDDEPVAEGNPGASGFERGRSARFIRNGVYGTRSSTVLTVERSGAITFEERSFDARAVETGTVAFVNAAGAGGFVPVRTPLEIQGAVAD